MWRIEQWETTLSKRFLDGFAAIPGARLYGLPTASGRTPTFAFRKEGVTPADLTEAFNRAGIFCTYGNHYAITLVDEKLQLGDAEGVVRTGFMHYNTEEDIDRILQAIAAA